MKKLIFLLSLAIFLSQTTFAQLQKRNFQLGGAVNFTNLESTNNIGDPNFFQNSSQSFSVNPSLGYFVTDKWVVGMSFKFSNGIREVRYKSPTPTSTDQKSETLGTGIFARRYFPIHDKIALASPQKDKYQAKIHLFDIYQFISSCEILLPSELLRNAASNIFKTKIASSIFTESGLPLEIASATFW